MVKKQKTAIIIGAGPAGLTAAYEFLKNTKIKPVVFEKSNSLGGISKTINYKGNRIDLGGHRFFSKSDRVMQWWLNILPIQKTESNNLNLNYQNKSKTIYTIKGVNSDENEEVMLVRQRKSRIYFAKKFFDYPISLTPDTLKKLGFIRVVKIGLSYLKSMASQIKPERNLEDFFINRFGKELYLTFFKSYTEKVWGIPCNKISAEWGAQRVKGLSIKKAIEDFISKVKGRRSDIQQKNVETSLIEQFLYPKYGPGQMWETVSKKIKSSGGKIEMNSEVIKLHVRNNKIIAIDIRNVKTGKKKKIKGDYFFSTMPVQELVSGLDIKVPSNIKEISDNLPYRDFITVGLLLNKLKIKDGTGLIKDTWIYIQEPDVLAGRLQIFNNWSPYLVSDKNKVWIGLEYCCYKTDKIWNLSNEEMAEFAIKEMEKIGILDKNEVIDFTVEKMEKTYPAYFGTYSKFDQVKDYLSKFENLFLIGRNGMHKYNNQDHSMLTAMTAVDNIKKGITSKENIWNINTEQEYHEENI